MLRTLIVATSLAIGMFSLPASAAAPRGCNTHSLPAAEKHRLQTEYARRHRADGKTSADLWAKEQGMRYRKTLERQGVCPPRNTKNKRTAPKNDITAEQTGERTHKKGKCTRTVMKPRQVANLGGGPMTMVMVPVCLN